ncbi:MAG: VCBS repeat-containing protein [Planctomycetota bacterium]
MRQLLSFLVAGPAILVLAGCGQGDSGRPGLILSKSLFSGTEPQPAELRLLRPPSGWEDGTSAEEEWSEERIVAEAGEVSLQTGTYQGELVFRRVEDSPDNAEESIGVGGVVDIQLRDKLWAVSDRPDIDPGEVAWDTNSAGFAKTKSYEIAGGNVFHKAMWWEPAFGDPGILTISANMPYLQMWRKELGTWESETLWSAEVGGKEQRFRDIEVGDVDGDGADELVVVTHDLGAIFVLEQTAGGIEATEIHRLDERTFVHEVEICDVDGDGALEFFTTPSEPNKLGCEGGHQAGGIDMFRYESESGAYARVEMAHFDELHAKEIFGYDYDEDGRSEIYGAFEGDPENVAIIVFRWDDGAQAMVEAERIEIVGPMCRFLNGGDWKGDGVRDLIASTDKGGVHTIYHDGKGWVSERIVPPFASSSFEHATLVFDWDGDGSDDVFLASDEQNKVHRAYWDAESGRAKREALLTVDGGFALTWNMMELPAGK